MTFEEALKLKSEFTDRFTKDGIEYRVYVTPNNMDDFLGKYRDAFDKHLIVDESAKTYNTHNDYAVRGICYYRDINRFWHSELPLL